MRRKALWVVMLAAVAVTAQGEPPVEEGIDPEQMLAQVQAGNEARLQQARMIAASGAPRDLYAAALLVPLQYDMARRQPKRDDLAKAWLARAIETGSDDPLIAAAAVRDCIAGGVCAIDKAVATLQRVGADESGTQLLLMRLAEQRKDADASAQAWQRAVAATHHDDELAGLVGLLEQATRGMPAGTSAAEGQVTSANPTADDNARIVQVFGVAAANWQPQPQLVQTNCRPEAVQQSARMAECRRLFQTLTASPSLMMARFGASWLANNAEAADQATWRERRRELTWVVLKAVEASNADQQATTPKVGMADYARWVAAEGELPAMHRLLTAHGISQQPPADWQPPTTP